MKQALLSWLLCITLAACNGTGNYTKAENAFDAGREFIDGCLKGDFDKARFYMLRNEANDKQLDKLQLDYNKKSRDEKEQYREASINILEEDTISDSVHVINYKNSFDNISRKVKVSKTTDGWLVDLQYTFSGNL